MAGVRSLQPDVVCLKTASAQRPPSLRLPLRLLLLLLLPRLLLLPLLQPAHHALEDLGVAADVCAEHVGRLCRDLAQHPQASVQGTSDALYACRTCGAPRHLGIAQRAAPSAELQARQ